MPEILDAAIYLKTYPNPVASGFSVEVKKSLLESLQLQLLDELGQKILTKPYPKRIKKGETIQLDFSNMPSGNYWLTTTGEQSTLVRQILKVN